MKIALLGGTFDPPHFGHLLVARQILEEVTGADCVWFLPANTNPDKKVFARAVDRLNMARFLEEPNIFVSDFDIKRGGETYTRDTINMITNDKENEYIWVMGSDLLSSVTSWQGYETFSKKIPFIIFPRPDYPIKKVPSNFVVLPENQLITVNYSSTIIRNRVGKNLSITGLVPQKVEEYITRKNLYSKKNVYV